VVGGRQLINLITREDCEADENGRLHLELDGYGYRWFRTGGIDRNVARP
jgi:maltose alpha-D-glucosyltransferase/alpha-amylase